MFCVVYQYTMLVFKTNFYQIFRYKFNINTFEKYDGVFNRGKCFSFFYYTVAGAVQKWNDSATGLILMKIMNTEYRALINESRAGRVVDLSPVS